MTSRMISNCPRLPFFSKRSLATSWFRSVSWIESQLRWATSWSSWCACPSRVQVLMPCRVNGTSSTLLNCLAARVKPRRAKSGWGLLAIALETIWVMFRKSVARDRNWPGTDWRWPSAPKCTSPLRNVTRIFCAFTSGTSCMPLMNSVFSFGWPSPLKSA